MKKYKVILHSDAETDISSAFEWGGGTPGERKMLEPGRSNFIAIYESGLPQHRFDVLLRRKVTILHLKGAYIGRSRRDLNL